MAVLLRRLFKPSLVRSVTPLVINKCKISEDYRPDYYSALGVSKAADVKQIKVAYFRMAKKYHPVSSFV